MNKGTYFHSETHSLWILHCRNKYRILWCHCTQNWCHKDWRHIHWYLNRVQCSHCNFEAKYFLTFTCKPVSSESLIAHAGVGTVSVHACGIHMARVRATLVDIWTKTTVTHYVTRNTSHTSTYQSVPRKSTVACADKWTNSVRACSVDIARVLSTLIHI